MIKHGQFSDLGSAFTLDVGTGAGQILQLDAGGKLPAVDGSNIINASGSGGAGGTKVLNIENQVLTGAFQIPNTYPCGTLLRVVNNTGTNGLGVTLPAAGDFSSGYYLTVCIYRGASPYDSANSVVLYPKSGDTLVDGALSQYLLYNYRGITCVSDGSSNWIFANLGRG